MCVCVCFLWSEARVPIEFRLKYTNWRKISYKKKKIRFEQVFDKVELRMWWSDTDRCWDSAEAKINKSTNGETLKCCTCAVFDVIEQPSREPKTAVAIVLVLIRTEHPLLRVVRESWEATAAVLCSTNASVRIFNYFFFFIGMTFCIDNRIRFAKTLNETKQKNKILKNASDLH